MDAHSRVLIRELLVQCVTETKKLVVIYLIRHWETGRRTAPAKLISDIYNRRHSNGVQLQKSSINVVYQDPFKG